MYNWPFICLRSTYTIVLKLSYNFELRSAQVSNSCLKVFSPFMGKVEKSHAYSLYHHIQGNYLVIQNKFHFQQLVVYSTRLFADMKGLGLFHSENVLNSFSR